jgi:hypothetical protein
VRPARQLLIHSSSSFACRQSSVAARPCARSALPRVLGCRHCCSASHAWPLLVPPLPPLLPRRCHRHGSLLPCRCRCTWPLVPRWYACRGLCSHANASTRARYSCAGAFATASAWPHGPCCLFAPCILLKWVHSVSSFWMN